MSALLTQIKENNYQLPPGANMDEVVTQWLTFVGHPNPEIRDKLVYATFNSLLDKNAVTQPQLKHILATALGEQHLFLGIGENGTDTVFTRTFSALFIAGVLDMHNQSPFLSPEEIQATKAAAIKYVAQEQDFRGYVPEKGWAHAMAHIADVLGFLATALTNKADLTEVQELIKVIACNPHGTYTAEEEDRLTFPAEVVIEAMTPGEAIDWLKGFNPTGKMWWDGDIPKDFYTHVNRKLFMRGLYHRLIKTGGYQEVCEFLLEKC